MGDKGCFFLRIDTGFLVVNCSLSAPPLGCWIPTGIVLDVKRDVLSARCCSEGASVDKFDSSHLLSHREVSLSTSEFNVKSLSSFPVLYCRDYASELVIVIYLQDMILLLDVGCALLQSL